ncbi:MAG: site-specific DNA-methyltransferase [Melioribacteraceae bacterium]|nr:site-specific DNA-methyltransferase [Melioribacteraceae bacterium]
MNKKSAPMNRSLMLRRGEISKYSKRLVKISETVLFKEILNKTINQNLFDIIDYLPDGFINLLFIDPPYNIRKNFNNKLFRERPINEYTAWIESFVSKLVRCLKPDASIYVCGDWKSSTSLHLVLSKYFIVRNRITWEREKGRGSKTNWKNNTEDIWFCTASENYKFNHNAVMLKRRVLAPYRDNEGKPKDWQNDDDGAFRLTHPSNIWNDISVPFWSMPENTEHPTQKPEKLLAKILLASSDPGEVVFDPFLGSGTTSVVAKKLDRNYVGIEIDKKYACIAEKRLELADRDKTIQGFHEGVFWERNSALKRNVK